MGDSKLVGRIGLLNYTHKSKGTARRHAVEAALEILRAMALGGGVPSGSLANHFSRLGQYADDIQAALKSKDMSPEDEE